VTASAAVALLLAVCAGVAQPSSAAPAAPDQTEPPPGILPEGEWTEAQANWLVNAVRAAERELPARFGSASQLAPLGFVNIGVLVPGGYSHYVNVSWMNDAHILNPQYPESLVYDSGGRVVAAMYFLGPEYTMETIPSLISWIPGWHTHPELCSDEQGRVVGIPINGQCTRGRPVTAPMTHVWIVDNECGHRFGGLDGGGLHCDYHDH
jgi:hypothetical protein